jgi:hypothetical protein
MAVAFPPQPLNFEDEAGIIRDLPPSPPARIHKLMIDVDDLGTKDFERLNMLYRHRTQVDEWILGVNNAQTEVGFALTRLFSLMRLFRPSAVMVQQSAQILLSEAFRDLLKTSPQLGLLVVDCSQEYELSDLDLHHIKELRVNILQDQHIECISNLGEGISKLHLWVSHGITPLALQGMVIPRSVSTLSLSTQQVSYEQFRMMSLAIRRQDTIEKLEIRWRGTNPADLLGMEPSQSIHGLDLHVSKFVSASGGCDFVSAMEGFLAKWRHVSELRISPMPVSTSTRSRLSKKDYLRFFSILRRTSFPALETLGLRVGNVLEKDYCDGLVAVVKNIQTLKGFHLAAQFPEDGDLEKVYTSKFNFYCDLHTFPKNVLSKDLTVEVWPLVLRKAKDMPSILFHFLRAKNDMLIPRGKYCGKRKRVDQ